MGNWTRGSGSAEAVSRVEQKRGGDSVCLPAVCLRRLLFGFRFTLHLSLGQGQAGVEQRKERERGYKRDRERGRVRKTAQ